MVGVGNKCESCSQFCASFDPHEFQLFQHEADYLKDSVGAVVDVQQYTTTET